MKLTDKDKARARKYRKCKPKQFGNLHERMQYVMAMLAREHSVSTVDGDLWHALWDLETEVSHYEPQNPPYGRRATRLGE